jgi:hypothetical protein
MSNDTNGSGGSDLDIFEGLGKKTSERSTPSAPPAPPGSASRLQAAMPAPDARRTLLGIPTPASDPPQSPAFEAGLEAGAMTNTTASSLPPVQPPPKRTASGTMRAVDDGQLASRPPPPPPPGRGSLPSVPVAPAVPLAPETARVDESPFDSSTTQRIASPAEVTPRARGRASDPPGMDMEWDDDNEATQVFEKDTPRAPEPLASAQALALPDPSPPERASMTAVMDSSAPSPAASAEPGGRSVPEPSETGSISDAFAALGQPRQSSAPRASSGLVPSAPKTEAVPAIPAPPATQRVGSMPPPPPNGQTPSAPMAMPPQSVGAGTTLHAVQSPFAGGIHGSAPPPPVASVPPPPVASVPPPPVASVPPPAVAPQGLSLEATHQLARAESSKAALISVLLLVVAAIAGVVVFFLMPRSGTMVVNVADAKGGPVNGLEISIDGTKRCDSAPCIVRELAAGPHQVSVTARGYEPTAPRALTVEARHDATADFQLIALKPAATGFKAAASHAGVKLSLDGKDVGELPKEFRDLEPGSHTLRFAADSFVALEKTITVTKENVLDLGTLSLKVARGKATISSDTPGAKVVLVNGSTRKAVPQLPITVEFDASESWQIQATKDGYEEFRQPITFEDGQAVKTFTVALSEKGKAPKADTANEAHSTPTPPKDAPPATPKSADPAATPAVTKEAKAPAGEATLKINSIPASTVVLDGKPLGSTPQLNVTVTPGTHTILFVNAELSLKKTITVTVKAGEVKAAVAKLRE